MKKEYRKNGKREQRTGGGSQIGPIYYEGQKVLIEHPWIRNKEGKDYLSTKMKEVTKWQKKVLRGRNLSVR